MKQPDSLLVGSALTPPRKGLEVGTFSLLWGAISVSTTAAGTTIGIGSLTISANTLASAIGSIALSGLSMLASQPKGGVQSPASQKKSYDLEEGPRIIVLGRARVGGVHAFRASKDYETYRLLAGCQGPIDGIEEYYVKDRAVTVDYDGAVSSPPYAKTGGSYLYLKNIPGTEDQAAIPELVSKFPETWTADHRLRGVSATLAKYISPGVNSASFLKIWPEGYPAFDLLVRGERMFDPRNPTHNANDRTTWSWSDNGVLCVLWLLTAPEDMGGLGLQLEQFDLDDIAAEADKADEDIPAKSGIEKRSKCSGSYTTDTPRGQILAEVLASTGCRMVRLQNGKHAIRLEDDNPSPTFNIERKNILEVAFGGDDLVSDANHFTLLHLSPERQWAMAEIAIGDKSWSRDQVSIEKTGKRSETLQLKFCPQSGQAQRIARRVIARRRSPRGEVITNLAGLVSMGHLAGTVEMDIVEDQYKPLMEVGSHKIISEAEISIPVTFIAPLSEWSVDDDEAPAPVALADVQFAGDIAKPDILGAAYVKTSASESRLRIVFSAAEGADTYEGTYRTFDGQTNGPRQSMQETTDLLMAESAPIPPGGRYMIEIRGASVDGEVGNWSDPIDFTTIYNEDAPKQCSVQLIHTGSGRVLDNYELRSVSQDINISTIHDGEANTYVQPGQTVVRPLTVFAGKGAPSGTVTFSNATGQTTTLNY